MQALERQKEQLASKFIKKGAVSKDSAIAKEALALDDFGKAVFRGMKSQGYIKKADNKTFYLDQKALENPTETFLKRYLKMLLIALPVVLLIVALFAVLEELGVFAA